MYWAIGQAFVNNTNNVTQTLARVAQLRCGSDSMTLTSGSCGLPPGRTTTFQVTAATDFRIFSCESLRTGARSAVLVLTQQCWC